MYVEKVRMVKSRPSKNQSERSDLPCHIIIGQSHDFCRAYSSLVARVSSFAPELSEGANDATRDTNKLYTRQK